MKPLILITNDDGIKSPGLLATVKAVCNLGDLLIVAPYTQQSGMGRAFPRTSDLGIIEEIKLKVNDKNVIGYGVHGSPAYAVAHGILELADRKPDLCISGINYGENLGMCLTCSGTLGAAFEANSHGIDSIAVSIQTDLKNQRLAEYKDMNWDTAINVVRNWTKFAFNRGLPKGVNTLNINIPINSINSDIYQITSQSKQNYFEFIKPEKRKFSKPYELKSELYVDADNLESNSDIHAVHIDKIISVTPISMDMSVKDEGIIQYLNP